MTLLKGSEFADKDQRDFFKTQILFWLLDATDGHAKNFSIVHKPKGVYCLTPLYDIISCHPIIGNGRNKVPYNKLTLAMSVRGKKPYYHLEDIQRRHWHNHAKIVGLGADVAEEMIEELVSQTDNVINQVTTQLPTSFPMDMANMIFEGIRQQCTTLKLS